ncbi:MAG: tetratricopeptide repeat protein [Verrucomicrobiales bacterium]|nr:tetratricopeptide repeat protein [Verrucomicrobiales bacterium]
MEAESPQQSSVFINLLGWLEVNKRKVAIGAGIALVAGLVIAYVAYDQSQKEVRASQALSEIRASYNPMQPAPPGLADSYFKVAKDYSGTKAGERAAIMGASALFVEGNYAGAQQRFEQFVKEYPESPWLAQAHFGIAAALDAQKKPAEAAAKYEEVRKRYPSDAVADETKLALGRLYEQQNKPEDAYKLYDELVKANQFSGIGSEAGIRMADLEEKYPQLVKTNTPPPGVNPMMNPTITRSNVNLQMITNKTTTGATNLMKRVLTNTGPVPGSGASGATPLKPNTTTPAPPAKP